MWVYLTHIDSTGRPVTRQLTVTIDGERYTITPTATGAAQVPAVVGEYLLASDDIAVAAEPPASTADSDPQS